MESKAGLKLRRMDLLSYNHVIGKNEGGKDKSDLERLNNVWNTCVPLRYTFLTSFLQVCVFEVTNKTSLSLIWW
jgi:hypothetical protein